MSKSEKSKKIIRPKSKKAELPEGTPNILVEHPNAVKALFPIPPELENSERHLYNTMRMHNALVDLGNVVWFNLDEGPGKVQVFLDLQALWKKACHLIAENS